MNTLGESIGGVIACAASREVEMKPGDYLDNAGIIICGKCNEPKQFIMQDFCGSKQNRLLPCMCRCEEAEYVRKQKELEEKLRLAQIKSLCVNGIQDSGIRSYRFETAEDSIYIQKCRKYVEQWDELFEANMGLIFCGPPECGKSFAAGCIANALTDRGIPVLVTSFPRILESKYDKTELITQMHRYDLVIIDDFGTERQSEYALETVYFTLDERYKSKKPLILTTNLGLADLQNPVNIEYERIYTRILEMCTPMVFKENRRRAKKAAEKLKRIKEIMADITNTEA